MDNPSLHIGQRLKELVNSKRIPVKEIAHKMNLTTQSVYNIFGRKTVGMDVLNSFCDAIEVNMNDVLLSNSQPDKQINTREQEVEYLQKENNYLRTLAAQQAQTILALVEKLGKFDASGLLAGYDA